jgi:hypothetical protein
MARGEEGRNKFARRAGLAIAALLVLVAAGRYAGFALRAEGPPTVAAPSVPAAGPAAARPTVATGPAHASKPADADGGMPGRSVEVQVR